MDKLKQYQKKIKTNKIKILIIQIALLAVFLLSWELLAKYKIIDEFLVSSPSNIIRLLIENIKSKEIFIHIFYSSLETLIALFIGTIFGIIIAILLYLSPKLSKILDPYLVVLNALPKVALAPIIIFWIGNGKPAIIVITLLISIVTTIISILTGFNEIEDEKIMLMKTFGASKIQMLKFLVFPYSIPVFISALKINVGLSWVGVIMGEFLVAKEGLGFLIIYGGQVAQLDMVMMSIVILSIVAFLMYEIVAVIQKKLVNEKNN